MMLLSELLHRVLFLFWRRRGGYGRIVALIFFLLAVSAHAKDNPSLFLTPAEAIGQDPFHQATTRLDAIVYYRPGQWQVWIDGHAFAPESQDAAVTILAVSPESVRFKQRLGDQDREIALAPHQVYLWAENKIVEVGAVPGEIQAR